MHGMINTKYAQKRDILTEKWENGMALEKWDFLPESGNVVTYDIDVLQFQPRIDAHLFVTFN